MGQRFAVGNLQAGGLRDGPDEVAVDAILLRSTCGAMEGRFRASRR